MLLCIYASEASESISFYASEASEFFMADSIFEVIIWIIIWIIILIIISIFEVIQHKIYPGDLQQGKWLCAANECSFFSFDHE